MLKVLTNNYPDVNHRIVEACQRGDRKAQYRLYKLYSQAMYAICMRMTNHAAEAEDILQEAFLDAFRNIDKFRGQATFGAWLKRIVINRTINHLKKRRAELVPVDEMDFSDEDDGPAYDETETRWRVDRVHQGIQHLPDGFRMVLTLYLLEGYDHKEIAEILGISESTSKSQYNRAKKKLVKIVNQL